MIFNKYFDVFYFLAHLNPKKILIFNDFNNSYILFLQYYIR